MSITNNHKKEAISYHAFSLIASNDGFNTANTQFDYGEDILLHEVEPQTQADGKIKFRGNGFSIAIQLKATTINYITDLGESISYQLESKNYNDMVKRNSTGAPTPLILVLYVGPSNINERIEVRTADEIVAKKCMYIYTTTETIETDNTSKTTIIIPKTNLIQVGTMNDLFFRFKSGIPL